MFLENFGTYYKVIKLWKTGIHSAIALKEASQEQIYVQMHVSERDCSSKLWSFLDLLLIFWLTLKTSLDRIQGNNSLSCVK